MCTKFWACTVGKISTRGREMRLPCRQAYSTIADGEFQQENQWNVRIDIALWVRSIKKDRHVLASYLHGERHTCYYPRVYMYKLLNCQHLGDSHLNYCRQIHRCIRTWLLFGVNFVLHFDLKKSFLICTSYFEVASFVGSLDLELVG